MRSHPLSRDNLDNSFRRHDESADFDDLMFALKSGMSFTIWYHRTVDIVSRSQGWFITSAIATATGPVLIHF